VTSAAGQDADQAEFGDPQAAGVMGTAVSSRMTEKAAREVCQVS
jgi:hypothetical protein